MKASQKQAGTAGWRSKLGDTIGHRTNPGSSVLFDVENLPPIGMLRAMIGEHGKAGLVQARLLFVGIGHHAKAYQLARRLTFKANQVDVLV